MSRCSKNSRVDLLVGGALISFILIGVVVVVAFCSIVRWGLPVRHLDGSPRAAVADVQPDEGETSEPQRLVKDEEVSSGRSQFDEIMDGIEGNRRSIVSLQEAHEMGRRVTQDEVDRKIRELEELERRIAVYQAVIDLEDDSGVVGRAEERVVTLEVELEEARKELRDLEDRVDPVPGLLEEAAVHRREVEGRIKETINGARDDILNGLREQLGASEDRVEEILSRLQEALDRRSAGNSLSLTPHVLAIQIDKDGNLMSRQTEIEIGDDGVIELESPDGRFRQEFNSWGEKVTIEDPDSGEGWSWWLSRPFTPKVDPESGATYVDTGPESDRLANVVILDEDGNFQRIVNDVPVEELTLIDTNNHVYSLTHNGRECRVVRSRSVYREGRNEPIYVSLEGHGVPGRFDDRFVFPYRTGIYYPVDLGGSGSKEVTYRFVR